MHASLGGMFFFPSILCVCTAYSQTVSEVLAYVWLITVVQTRGFTISDVSSPHPQTAQNLKALNVERGEIRMFCSHYITGWEILHQQSTSSEVLLKKECIYIETV
ncbi:hypothetical protein CHARACLAT_014657 [Characodon lateralis]|uniref:Secreted protein n=1 Tax=Characodon lateralis TaxID=208331 RepID=A0ABU7CY82_9TELE|nr:hypothetical protein [Characodon lateralis]